MVMDRGFYSADNMNALYKGHYKFLIATKSNNKFVLEFVKKTKAEMHDFTHYDLDHELYHTNNMEMWPYVLKDSSGNIIREEKRRIYIHIYYNGMRGEEEKLRFSKRLALTEAAIRSETTLTETQKALRNNYFTVKKTPKRGVQIQYKEDEIKKRMDQCGYFVLLSNDIKESDVAIEVYRKKDMVEKAFDNLKDRLEMKRTMVHSDQALAGKFFLQFLALIYVSYIHKHMREHKLYRNYTMQTLIDSLDVIERYDYERQKYHCSEITKKQQDLFACFGVASPTTL